MDTIQVTFRVPDSDHEIAFLREYMVPAWDRLEATPAFKSGWFWRAGAFAHHDHAELTREEHDLEHLDPGTVHLIINGDATAVVETEREHWRAVAADGPLDDWATTSFRPDYVNAQEKLRGKYGPAGGDRVYALRQLAAETTVALLAEFEEPLPVAGEATEANPVPIGYWAMIQYIMKPLGYDWYQEIDACSRAIRNRLVSLAAFTSEAEARELLGDVIDDLEAFESRFDG
jgi:hypothetical protein